MTQAAHLGYDATAHLFTGMSGVVPTIRPNIGHYQFPQIESRPTIPQYTISSTPVVYPVYNSTIFLEFSKTIEQNLSIKRTLDKEIESDEFLKEFFSTTKKVERMPTIKQIKEQYYSR
jgi:hypothetical protein